MNSEWNCLLVPVDYEKLRSELQQEESGAFCGKKEYYHFKKNTIAKLQGINKVGLMSKVEKNFKSDRNGRKRHRRKILKAGS